MPQALSWVVLWTAVNKADNHSYLHGLLFYNSVDQEHFLWVG